MARATARARRTRAKAKDRARDGRTDGRTELFIWRTAQPRPLECVLAYVLESMLVAF